MIYETKFCLNIDVVFKLFEIVVVANFHDKYSQKYKKVSIFLSFFAFEKKTMAQCLSRPFVYIWDSCKAN